MYKFTNGIVVFDEKTKNEYLKAGYKLLETQLTIEEAIEQVIEETNNEVNIIDGIVEKKSRKSNKASE